MSNQIVFFREITELDRYSIPQEAKIAYHNYVHKSLWMLEHLGSTHATLFVKLGKESEINDENERLRKEATKVWTFSKEKKISNWNAIYDSDDLNHVVCFFEGFLLSQYQYTAFLKPSEEPTFTSDMKLMDAHQTNENTSRKIVEAVCTARTLVNMPSNLLTAEKLAEEFVSLGEKCGFETQILGKSQIESQKMGGLLSVNKGSQLPPTFSILTYKHENAINEKTIILIGKYVSYTIYCVSPFRRGMISIEMQSVLVLNQPSAGSTEHCSFLICTLLKVCLLSRMQFSIHMIYYTCNEIYQCRK
jgi:leucyl aminopeptidase